MNITKKRLLKIKKTKNQSRKIIYPKYKKNNNKNKKNKSFRKRKKHNLRNKSLKNYKKLVKKKKKQKIIKQKGGEGNPLTFFPQINIIKDKIDVTYIIYDPKTKTINKFVNIEDIEKLKRKTAENLKMLGVPLNNEINMVSLKNLLNKKEGQGDKKKSTYVVQKVDSDDLKKIKINDVNFLNRLNQLLISLKRNEKITDTIKNILIDNIFHWGEDMKPYLKKTITISYSEERKPTFEIPLWKCINSIALLTKSLIINLNDKDAKTFNEQILKLEEIQGIKGIKGFININSFNSLRNSLTQLLKKESDFNNQLVFYYWNGTKYKPCLNWNPSNNIFYNKQPFEDIQLLKNIFDKLGMKDGDENVKRGGGTDGEINNLNKFIDDVIKVKDAREKLDDSDAASEEIYNTFLVNANEFKKKLKFINQNKTDFFNLKKAKWAELEELIKKNNEVTEFDEVQAKNNIVKLMITMREKHTKDLIQNLPEDERAKIEKELQEWKGKKQKETEDVEAMAKIADGKEVSKGPPKMPGSFSMGNYFNAAANEKYPNDQYIVPESLEPWGITIDPEKSGLFARFNIRQHPYQFAKDLEVIADFSPDTPEWLQFVGDSLEDRRGITPAYKPPIVVGATTEKAISEAEGQKEKADEAVDKARSGKRSISQGIKLGLKGNLSKEARKKADVKEKEKAASTAKKVVDAKKKKRKEIDKKGKDTGKGKKSDETKDDKVILSKDPA